MAESIAPTILWLDELEKGFSGTQSSGISDGGTTARVFASFITWLQEKTAPVFVVATANRVEELPPELLRKGRFDEIFFVDLPSEEERKEIFEIHIKKRKRDPANFDLKMLGAASQGYSGAEIEQVVVGALYDAFDAGRDINTDDLLTNIRVSVPLSRTMAESIEELREWASTRARNASVIPGKPKPGLSAPDPTPAPVQPEAPVSPPEPAAA
jgi:SpoVK/Ycf46/Vps4 family AAA+-type ATPase